MERPEKLVFVGGAPRSGTTVTHALLSTSSRVSPYHPEISFYRGFPISYRNGRAAWKQHTAALFENEEAFRLTLRSASDVALDALWRRLGCAPILCMKDPLLTPFFREVQALYPQESYFVVTVRHPVDVVRSRQEVHERSNNSRPFAVGDAMAVAREYMSYYQGLLSASFGGRLFMFRYEDLNETRIREGLSRFIGVDDLMARPMWGDEQVPQDDPWSSPKYNQAIDLGARLSPLAPHLAEPVRAFCAPIMQRFGYD